MAFLAGFRARRLSRQADRALAREGFAAAAALLDAAAGLQGGAWAHFAVGLYNQGRKDDAETAIRRALALEPGRGDALIFLAELLAETDRSEEAITVYRELLARFPQAAPQALALAKLLLPSRDFAAIRDLLAPFSQRSQEILMLVAQAHFALDEHQAVVALLGPALEQMYLDLKRGLLGAVAHRGLWSDYQDANRLYSEAYAAVHGREKVIETALARGTLDARAAVNYRLLGESRMADPPSWTPDTRLRSVADSLTFGQALIDGGERSRGLCHIGAAELRQGRVAQARRSFDRARGEDDGNFAAYLGVAAAMELEATRAFDRLQRLPDVPVPPHLERVVTDWPALTADERKVVTLVAAPVAGVLARIADAGACARLLPIDARLTDLPEMEPGAGERHDDHRCLEAITGAATEQVSASKIEDLLSLTGEHHSVFAHELAHLVHFHLPEPQQAEIERLYQAALDHEHVATDYQTTNAAEFFAVAYTDFIADAYDLPSRREPNDEGVVDETFTFIQTLRQLGG